ncbi:MAG TPA: LamG-like jellyroll fold domain-containing protein [Dermatophilaceae bacterium]
MSTLVRRVLVTGSTVLMLQVVLATTAFASSTPVGLWHMDELSGTTMSDSSGHGNNGTLSHVTVGVPGFTKTGYSFNGSSSIATVPSSTSLNPGTQNFSLIVHVKFTVLPGSVGDYDVIRKGLSSTPGGDYKMEILSTGKASCHWKGSSGSTPDTKPGLANLADGKWHTVTCSKAATSEQLFVDGVSQWTQTVTIGSISNTAPLTIGAKSSGGDWYKGKMDQVSVSVG